MKWFVNLLIISVKMTWVRKHGRNLSNRLKQTVSNRQENRPERYWCKEFLPKGDDNFNGTIKFLVDESNGDISEKVVLTALANQHLCKCVPQYNTNDYYSSNNSENSWICFDFKDKRIIPSNYQIKSRDDGTLSDYHWGIEWKRTMSLTHIPSHKSKSEKIQPYSNDS